MNIIRKRGYTFISLDEALKDKIYSRSEKVINRGGFSWLHRWRMTDGKKTTLQDVNVPADIQLLYDKK